MDMSPTASVPSDAVKQGCKLERRRSPRTPHVAEAWISSPTATNPDERIEVTSMNLSRHGVGFELAKPIPEHTFYAIEIGMGDQRLISEIRIVSCRKSDHGTWEVGAEFC
jgi:PilZ domain